MATQITKSQLLDDEEAARFLDVSPTTLRTWRCRKRYLIPYLKIGGKVRYDLDDLIGWLASRKVNGQGQEER